MIRSLPLAVLAVFMFAASAFAEGRSFLGYGRLFTNDIIGDFRDRWQTGSITSSRVRGYGWHGSLPEQPFDLMEYRLGGQIIAPSDLRDPSSTDRPFAGALSFGVHTHFQNSGNEYAVGADLVVTGPQTLLGDLHTAIHDGLGVKPAKPSVLEDQIEDGFHPTFVGEAGRQFPVGAGVVRPFAEVRWGAETLARLGADYTLGPVGAGELLVRDPVTGQRYRVIYAESYGSSFVLGGDIARVDSSVFLPEDRGYKVEDYRTRLRVGWHWQGETNSTFYGLTWLSEEFENQPNGQFVGSARIKYEF